MNNEENKKDIEAKVLEEQQLLKEHLHQELKEVVEKYIPHLFIKPDMPPRLIPGDIMAALEFVKLEFYEECKEQSDAQQQDVKDFGK
jgi:hypothetical protein